jgi:predicted ATPase
MLCLFRLDYTQAIEFADEGVNLAAAKNFGFLETALIWSRNCTRVLMGAERDVEVVRKALAAYNEPGTNLHMPVNQMMLARCFGSLGRADLGLASVNRAFVLIDATEQRNWEAETWRVKGDLILQQLVPDGRAAEASGIGKSEAEACICKAIEITRRQQSKLFELRALMSLVRLLKGSGRLNEALAMLSEVYHWFSEGFDSVDLRQARNMLDELPAAG